MLIFLQLGGEGTFLGFDPAIFSISLRGRFPFVLSFPDLFISATQSLFLHLLWKKSPLKY